MGCGLAEQGGGFVKRIVKGVAGCAGGQLLRKVIKPLP